MPRGGVYLKMENKAESMLPSSSSIPSGQRLWEWYPKAEREVAIFLLFPWRLNLIQWFPDLFSAPESGAFPVPTRRRCALSPGSTLDSHVQDEQRWGVWGHRVCLEAEARWSEEAGSLEGKEKQAVLTLTRQMQKLLQAESTETSSCAGE